MANVTEPIVTTGRFGNADFVAVRYLDATNAVLLYDTWGSGGPSSEPFALQPGVTHSLEIDLPSLAVQAMNPPHPAPLHIRLDGRELLGGPVHFHGRAFEELYLGTDPVGGSTSPKFRGQLFSASGRQLHGVPTALFGFGDRLSILIGQHGIGLLLAALVCSLAAWSTLRLLASEWLHHRLPSPRAFTGSARPPHVAFLLSLIACTALFVVVLTGGTFQFLYPDSFSTFFDYQAQSLLHGHLDVPEPALSGEAFVVHGKVYGYFGITPALLRIPFAAMHVGFGELARGYMLLYYVAALGAAYGLLRQATILLCGPGRWPSAWGVALFTTVTGVGSTLFFLGSRAYVYHEASLCSAMFALWSVYFSIRYLRAPTRGAWTVALALGTLSLHARPTSGLFALCLLGTVALAHLIRAVGTRVRDNVALSPGWLLRHVGIGVCATLGILSFNLLSYAKFGTFDGAPLRYHVQYTPERLANFDGRNFHLANIGHNADAYFIAPAVRFEPHFPWIFIAARERVFVDAKIDVDEPTLAVPWAMPALFLLATAGATWAFLVAPTSRVPLATLAVALVPMLLALLCAIANSQRYTADFCPFLIATGAWALATLDCVTGLLRRTALTVLSALVLASVAVTTALTIYNEGAIVWGVPDAAKANYTRLCKRVDALFGIR